MGFLSNFFIDATSIPRTFGGMIQLIYITGTYIFILMNAASMISEGSELLLLVPSYADLVGSLVLPILGSLPDALIVLFSGLGPNAQEQLDVGIGAMAGSAVLLTTIAWFLSIYFGRVSINPSCGVLTYKASKKLNVSDYYGLNQSGVHVDAKVNKIAWIVIVTCLPYIFLQGPGLFINGSKEEIAQKESVWALAGLIVCLVLFIGYLTYQFYAVGEQEELRNSIIVEAIRNGEVSLLGVMKAELGDVIFHHRHEHQELNKSTNSTTIQTECTSLLQSEHEELKKKLTVVLRPFFHKYDISQTNTLDMIELAAAMRDLGEIFDHEQMKYIFKQFDKDDSGAIDFDEFIEGIIIYLQKNTHLMYNVEVENVESVKSRALPAATNASESMRGQFGRMRLSSFMMSSEKAEAELKEYAQHEYEDIPEDLQHLTPDEQQQNLIRRSLKMMALGTFPLVFFSDPLVEALSEVGERTGAGAFAVSFLLAPLVGNAPELIATYKYSTKKTTASITVAHTTLLGSVIVGNTFAMGVFVALIYFQSLVWEYLAETLTILVVQFIVAIMCMKPLHTMLDGLIILSLYPLSLLLVFSLQSIGWD